jgi:hypothetical protein
MVNTEIYSWDTSFGLVNPCLRYSCGQVVFCVNLGTFFKCFLQLEWGLLGVRSTQPKYSLIKGWVAEGLAGLEVCGQASMAAMDAECFTQTRL